MASTSEFEQDPVRYPGCGRSHTSGYGQYRIEGVEKEHYEVHLEKFGAVELYRVLSQA